MKRLGRCLAALGLALLVVVLGDAASWADPVATVSCRDATSGELGTRAGGTTCSWSQVSGGTACATYDLSVSGPLLVGMVGPLWSANTTATSFTVFHPALTLGQGYRMVVSVICVSSLGAKTAPYVLGYDVGRCPASGACSTADRSGAWVQVVNVPQVSVSGTPSVTVGNTPGVNVVSAPPVSVQVTVPPATVALPPCPAPTADPSASPSPAPSPSSGTYGVDCALSTSEVDLFPIAFGLAVLVLLAVTAFVLRHSRPLLRR